MDMDAWTPADAGDPVERQDEIVPFAQAKERCVDRFERIYLERLMSEAGGNLSQAARMARMDRKYLRALLKRHELWEAGRRGPRRKVRPEEKPREVTAA